MRSWFGFVIPVAAVAALLFGAACGEAAAGQAPGKGEPGVTGVAVQPSAPPDGPDETVSEAQLAAVAEDAFPLIQPFGYFGSCDVRGTFTTCPFTERLQARLGAEKQVLMRADNPSPTRAVSAEVTGPDGGIVHVSLFSGRERLDLVVVRRDGRLLIDDSFCSGDRGTSVYQPPIMCWS